MHKAVARLLDDLRAAGADLQTPAGQTYVTARTDGPVALYARTNWVSIATPAADATRVLAGGHATVEKEGRSTWYLRYTGEVLEDAHAYTEARNLALERMGLAPAAASAVPATMNPSSGGSVAGADLTEARALFEGLAAYPAFRVEVVEGPRWTWARVGMGPFPARVVLDADTGKASVEVVVGYAERTERIEELVASIPMPAPEVWYELGPESVVFLAYRAPLARLTQNDAVGLLAAAALYTNALAANLFDDLAEVTRRSLMDAGFRPGAGVDRPRETFLPASPLPFPGWEQPDSPTPASALTAPPSPPGHLGDEEARLALSVARCPQVPLARANPDHDCHTIVTLQPEDPATWQVPEPWAGNLTGGQIIFISSNPSINEAEEYPRGDWPDEKIADFVTHRFSHGWVSPDDRVLLRDGTYHPDRVQYWLRIRQRAEELLGRPADPAVDYAMTEVVHCKSRRERGVARAATLCASLHLKRIIAASPAALVVVVGSKARDELRPLWDLPEDFGSRETLGVHEWANLIPLALGRSGGRVIAYLPHPTGMEPLRDFAGMYPTFFPGLQLLARGQITPDAFVDQEW